MEEKKVKSRANKKKKEIQAENAPFESRKDIKKLLWYTVIVSRGQGENIVRLLKENKCSAVYMHIGEGTANSEIRGILGVEDTKKDIIYSLVREDYIQDVKKEIDIYFAANKRNRGIAYTIKLDSIVGVKLYKFFTQTVRG